MSEENQKVPFYKKTWFIVVMLIFVFPVGLILMWMHKDWSRKVKGIVTAATLLFALSVYTTDDDTEETASTNDEEVAAEESEEPAEEEVEEETPVEEESAEEESVEPEEETEEPVEEVIENDVISIVENQSYVIDAELIEEDYTLGTEENIEVFSPEDDEHYKIQMDHHGGLFGSQNLDRIKELIESITEENAEYDYLVFEILRTDQDEGDRWVYTRFNQEQAINLLGEEEMDDETFEETSDFFVSGGDADVGFNEESINYDDMTAEELVEYAVASSFDDSLEELHVNENEYGVNIEVHVGLGASWSESSAVSSMKRDIASFLGDLHYYDLDYGNVLITFEGELVDQAGNESINDVLISEYSNETIKEINPDNIGIVSENIDNLADAWWLHPTFHGE